MDSFRKHRAAATTIAYASLCDDVRSTLEKRSFVISMMCKRPATRAEGSIFVERLRRARCTILDEKD
jgi:hypothetical protein